jgi:hypothetical protein
MRSVDFLIRSAPGLHLSKLIFRFVKRDAEIRTMRLPNVSEASSHNLIAFTQIEIMASGAFGVNPDSAPGLNPWRAPAEFPSFFASNYTLNEFLLYRNNDVAFNHRRPALRP